MIRTPPRRGVRHFWRTVAAALLATVLTGCLKIDMDLSVEGAAVDGSMVAAIDADTAELLGMDAEQVFDPSEEDVANLDGVTVAPYTAGDWVGVRYTFNQANIDDLNTLAGADEEFPTIAYDVEEGTYEFTMMLDFSDWFGDPANEDPGIPGLDPAAMQERFETTVAVTFPGQVIEHNGELHGTTVSWAPELGERVEMHAIATASGTSLPAAGDDSATGPGDTLGFGGSSASTTATLLGALIGLLILTAVASTFWVVLRNRASAGAGTEDAQPSSEPADAEQPQQ